MYGPRSFQARRAAAHPYAPGFYAPPQAYSYPAEEEYYSPYHYQSTPAYGYAEPMDYEEPSELEMLDYEEQRLLDQQRRLLAQRRRIAEQKRALQQREAQEQARLRKQRIYQEQWKRQQQQLRETQAQQYAARTAALKEAQLEAALRELEEEHENIHPAYHARPTVSEKRTLEPENPVAFLIDLLGGRHALESSNEEVPRPARKPQHRSIAYPVAEPSKPKEREYKRQKTAEATSAQPANLFHAFFAPAHAFQTAEPKAEPKKQATPKKPVASPSKPQSNASASSSRPTSPAKPAPKPSASLVLNGLQQRVGAVRSRVSELLNTSFAQLTQKMFGSVENELMQILLALDNVNVETDDALATRKALVRETVSLLEQVDQYKEAFKCASQSTSSEESHSEPSNESNADTSAHPSDAKPSAEPIAEANVAASTTEAVAAPSSVESLVSNAALVAEPVEAFPKRDTDHEPVLMDLDENKSEEEIAQAPETIIDATATEVEAAEDIDADERASLESSSSNTNMDIDVAEVEGDGFFSQNMFQALQELESEEAAPSQSEQDPFGLKALASQGSSSEAAKPTTVSIPVQSKTRVTIE